MKLVIGIIVTFGSVLGGFVLSKGQLLALWQPYELLIIGGAAIGGFLVANPPKVALATLKGIAGTAKGPAYKREHYMELLAFMHTLLSKARREGLMAIEDDIESPEESELFQQYPKVLNDHHARDFICDYMRLVVGGGIGAFELDNLMSMDLETHHEETMQPAHAVQQMADALPGYGIVAAVLGIVITMSLLGEDQAVIGQKVAAALVGTFLGILLAYGLVGPLAQSIQHKAEEEAKFLECVRAIILASVQGYSPQIAVEFGRKSMLSHVRPGFEELERHLKGEPAAGS